MQKTLEEFFNPFTIQTKTRDNGLSEEPISHREIIIFLLQFGIPFTEKGLFRALKDEIIIHQAKGRLVLPITYQGMQRQLLRLAQERIVEQIGFCWRLRS